MPTFKSPEHRAKWIRSVKRTFAKKRKQRDALASGGQLGLKKPSPAPVKHGPNGHFDEALNYLRQQRVQAEDRVTMLHSAIQSLENLK